MNIDASIVEILREDEINFDSFLEPDIENNNNFNKLNDKKIWIYQYADCRRCSLGKISEIENTEITHLASTKSGSSRNPIFLEDCKKVLGIHK